MTDLQNFVHRGGVLFADSLGNIKNTRTGHILTHGYFNDIADLHIIRRAGYFAVYRDVLCVADSFATVRRFIRRDTLRYLSSLITFRGKSRILSEH